MKTTFKKPSLIAISLIAGVVLAALCKLIYDLFNGYATVPNLLMGMGVSPFTVFLEALQFFCLGATAFVAGKFLLKTIPSPSRTIAFAIALPWVALCVWGTVNGLVRENGQVLVEINRSSSLSRAVPLLMILAVPFGVRLAYRSKRTERLTFGDG